ncbi:MAG: MFS transporter [Chloroflexota bacterium]
MSRFTVPEFIHEVIDDPRQRGILISGSLALFAVGLVPRVLSPGLPTAQEALRAQPEIENLFLLLSFASTATIIVGGLVSDLFRRRALLVGGLALMLAGSITSVVFPHGPMFYAANFTSIAAAGVVLAYGIGSVAVAYEGVARATALGFVYGAFGAGSAASPAVLTLFPRLIPSEDPDVLTDFTFDTWLAYSLTAVAAGIALWAALRWMPRIPGSLPASRTLITGVAAWSVAILAIVSGVLGLGGPGGQLLPMALIVGGGIGLATLTFRFSRTSEAMGKLRLEKRGLGAALSVGIAVGFAQAVPLMLLPVVFEYPLRYGTLFAVFAIAPFAVALLLAGPISGILIRRFGPRGMMSGGTLMLGVANIALAVVLMLIAQEVRNLFEADPTRTDLGLGPAHYLLFILPLVLVGAGFVLSTTVRTAIVFASTPRGLPASAAAINEASVGLGSRLGIVVATTALTLAALGSAREMVAGRTDAVELVDEFNVALISLGTPRFKEIYAASLAGAEPVKGAAYSVAYMDGVVAALAISGAVGLIGALIAWVLTGRRDPLKTVFDMQDERDEQARIVAATTPSPGKEAGPA